MGNLLLTLIMGVFILSCATSGEQAVVLISGEKERHRIDCTGQTNSWLECYREADEICGGMDFRILIRSDDGGRVARRTIGWFDSSTIIRRMVIQCIDKLPAP